MKHKINTSYKAAVFSLALISCLAFADAKEDGDQGISEYEKGNLIVGMQLMQKAAEAGYAPAQARYGYILDQAEENDLSFKWLKASAEQNNAEGQFGLAKMYAKGEGTEQNFELARTWFIKAAEQQHSEAMRVYGLALEKGNFGFAVEPAKALEWYSKAAEHGDAIAIKRLISVYENGELGAVVDLAKAQHYRDQSEVKNEAKTETKTEPKNTTKGGAPSWNF